MKQTWKMPDPPDPAVIVLSDSTGRRFHRVTDAGDYWHSEELGMGRGTYSWTDLLEQRGEVEDAS